MLIIQINGFEIQLLTCQLHSDYDAVMLLNNCQKIVARYCQPAENWHLDMAVQSMEK